MDNASTSRAESFDGVEFVFFHSRSLASSNDGHSIASVNSVRIYRVSIQVANGFDLVSLAVDFDLVGFHHFLDGSSDVAQPDVDSGLSDSVLAAGFFFLFFFFFDLVSVAFSVDSTTVPSTSSATWPSSTSSLCPLTSVFTSTFAIFR